MMKDFLLNEDNSFKVLNGDLVIGEATEQHQRLLLLAKKGDYKENPLIGVGAAEFLKDEDESGLMAAIKQEFEKDGMSISSIKIVNGELKIDASY